MKHAIEPGSFKTRNEKLKSWGMHWLKSSKNNTNQQLLKSKHLRVSYLEGKSIFL